MNRLNLPTLPKAEAETRAERPASQTWNLDRLGLKVMLFLNVAGFVGGVMRASNTAAPDPVGIGTWFAVTWLGACVCLAGLAAAGGRR